VSTAIVDGMIRDILYALRGFRRAPLATFTMVFTVALGLGLVAVAFTFLNTFLFRVDRVPSINEMVALEPPQTSTGERPPLTRAHLDALRRETSIFTDAYAEVSGIDFPVDGRTVLFTLTTGNFFQVAGVNAAMGRTLTTADDDPSAGRAVGAAVRARPGRPRPHGDRQRDFVRDRRGDARGIPRAGGCAA